MPHLRSLAFALIASFGSAQAATETSPATPPAMLKLAQSASAVSLEAPAAANATATPRAAAKPKPDKTVEDPLAVERPQFTRPPALKGNIAFWRKVFGQYSENQSVMHDPRKPERVYEILDFRDDAERLSRVQLAGVKNAGEKAARARIESSLRRAWAQRDNPETLDDDGRRMLALFANEPAALADADSNIRSQRGLKERTREALLISGQYLPEMEKTFAEAGMPRLLTRLPFVESSFNVDAYSKVAAAGLWQFMPASARHYMRLNHVADDRRDPWVSTKAAAEHLKDDYQALQNWPLAVTAYNYGRSGLLRALKETGGETLDDLLARYDSKRFGFASRNFYAEFLAATDVERDWREHFGEIERRAPMRFELVRIDRYTPWKTLLRISGTDEESFRRFNPAYRNEVLGGKLYVPAGDSIRVPPGTGEAFRLAYEKLGEQETYGRQRELFFTVKVGKGETLSAIAKRYGVSERTLRGVNGLKKGKLRAGQRLSIPNDTGAAPLMLAQADSPRPPRHDKAKLARAGSRVHKVREGQSLSVIARRYNTSVSQLLRLNALADAGRIRAGMRLKVPG